MSIGRLLQLGGYTSIPLMRSNEGQLHAAANINGRPVSAFLDTGCARSVVSLTLVRDMGLPVAKLPFHIGGAGAARLDVYQVAGAEFMIDNVKPLAPVVLATDLDGVNRGRSRTQDWLVDVVVGADVLALHQAVIDYGADRLYLKL
jgi:predicted aspartyl protease